jgi:sugar/nucleoside kinase (ribokinase family)
VNEDEAVSMTRKASVEEAYDELADRTASPVIKRGPRGAFAAGRRFPAFPVQVKDPTGAGDSFAAGFLYATKEKAMEFEDAVRFGCAAGAVCCTFEGGVSAELTFERAMRLFA